MKKIILSFFLFLGLYQGVYAGYTPLLSSENAGTIPYTTDALNSAYFSLPGDYFSGGTVDIGYMVSGVYHSLTKSSYGTYLYLQTWDYDVSVPGETFFYWDSIETPPIWSDLLLYIPDTPNSCATPEPSNHILLLVRDPIAPNTPWVYDQDNAHTSTPCSYSCGGGYTGSLCLPVPPPPPPVVPPSSGGIQDYLSQDMITKLVNSFFGIFSFLVSLVYTSANFVVDSSLTPEIGGPIAVVSILLIIWGVLKRKKSTSIL